MNNNISKTQFLTRTALILALTITFQLVGRFIPHNNFVVGPLVNMCLLVATAFTGVWSGVIIAVVSPFASLINNHAPVAAALLPFAPFVAIGNILFVVSYYFLRKKSQLLSVLIGAVLKFGFLMGAITIFLKIFSFPKFAKVLILLFGWPQLITAVVGGVMALLVIQIMEKNKSLN